MYGVKYFSDEMIKSARIDMIGANNTMQEGNLLVTRNIFQFHQLRIFRYRIKFLKERPGESGEVSSRFGAIRVRPVHTFST